jgi:hypothetical protein
MILSSISVPNTTAQYGFTDPTTAYRNSNLSPQFPYEAKIWKSLWEPKSRTKADGIISIDPVALSYVLGPLGSVTMPGGEAVTPDNLSELIESPTTPRFAADNNARKEYREVVRKMTAEGCLGKAVNEGRIASGILAHVRRSDAADDRATK